MPNREYRSSRISTGRTADKDRATAISASRTCRARLHAAELPMLKQAESTNVVETGTKGGKIREKFLIAAIDRKVLCLIGLIAQTMSHATENQVDTLVVRVTKAI